MDSPGESCAQHSQDKPGGEDTRGIQEKAPWGTSLCQDLEGGLPSILPERRNSKTSRHMTEKQRMLEQALKEHAVGGGELVPWLRALAAKAEDLDSAPSTHMEVLNHL